MRRGIKYFPQVAAVTYAREKIDIAFISKEEGKLLTLDAFKEMRHFDRKINDLKYTFDGKTSNYL